MADTYIPDNPLIVQSDRTVLLEALARLTGLPLITGKTSQDKRDRLYQAFREGDIDGLVLSRVGNFALDLPDADVGYRYRVEILE